MKRKLTALVVSGLLALVSHNVSAQGNWFAGAGIGQSENNDYDCTGCGAAIGSLDDTGTAWKLFGGYQFNPYFAIQGGYLDLADTTATGVGGAFTDKLEVDGVYAALQGIWPISSNFDVYANVGLFHWDQKVTFNATSGSFDGTDPFFGIGGSYIFNNPGVKLQLEWNRYNDVGTNDINLGHLDDYDTITLQAVFQF